MIECKNRCQDRIVAVFVVVFMLFVLTVFPGCVFVYVEGNAENLVIDDHDQIHRVTYDLPPIDPHDQPDFSNDIDPGFTHDNDRVRL